MHGLQNIKICYLSLEDRPCVTVKKKKSFYLYPKLHGVTSVRNLLYRCANVESISCGGVVVLGWTSAVCFYVTFKNSALLTYFQNAWTDPPPHTHTHTHISTTCSNRTPHFVKRGLADRVVTIVAVVLRQPNFRRRAPDGTTVGSISVRFQVVCRIILAKDKIVRSSCPHSSIKSSN